MLGLPVLEKLRDSEANVLGDLPQKSWRNIATCMKGNRCRASGIVAELLVRTTLAHFKETQLEQDRDHLGRLENRDVSHSSRDGYVLHPDEL